MQPSCVLTSFSPQPTIFWLDESIYPRENIDHKRVGIFEENLRDGFVFEPILYAAKMAIGPKQLTEAETRNTARRAFQVNSRLTASEIGRAIGRSRQAVDKYMFLN